MIPQIEHELVEGAIGSDEVVDELRAEVPGCPRREIGGPRGGSSDDPVEPGTRREADSAPLELPPLERPRKHGEESREVERPRGIEPEAHGLPEVAVGHDLSARARHAERARGKGALAQR